MNPHSNFSCLNATFAAIAELGAFLGHSSHALEIHNLDAPRQKENVTTHTIRCVQHALL